MFSLGLSTLGFAPSLPTLTGDFCADVVETLTVDGSAPLPGKNYTLCVDKTNQPVRQRSFLFYAQSTYKASTADAPTATRRNAH